MTWERDVDREIQFHLEQAIQDYIAQGFSPDEARRRATADFGSIALAKEEARDTKALRWLTSLIQDVRYAIRGFGRSPGFVAVVVLLLALGIGANAALFSVVDAALLRKLDVEKPNELVLVAFTPPRTGWNVEANEYTYKSFASFSYPNFQALKAHNETLSELFGIVPRPGLVTANGITQATEIQRVSGNYHEALRERGVLGRMLTEADDVPGAEPVAVISYRYWQRRFGMDRAAVGSHLVVDGERMRIVGVTSQRFQGTGGFGHAPDVTAPLASAVTQRSESQIEDCWIFIMGRLKPGVTYEQVKANLDAFLLADSDGERSSVRVTSASRGADSLLLYLGQSNPSAPPPVPLLVIAFGLLLLVGCVNLSNLLLARAFSRQQEIGIRRAMGASRLRLIRQLLTETTLLGLLGGAAGALVAYWGKNLLWAYLPGSDRLAADLIDFRINSTVLVFTACLSVMTGILFGIVPALRVSRAEQQSLMTQTVHSALTRSRLNRLLLMIQVAVCIMLVAGGAVFLSSLQNLVGDFTSGLPADNILQFSVSEGTVVRVGGIDPPELIDLQRIELIRAPLLEAIEGLPGVTQVTTWGPATGLFNMEFVPVRRNYFSTVGIPIVSGQDLSSVKDSGGARFVVINETLARRLFPNQSPIGKELPRPQQLPPDSRFSPPQFLSSRMTIVGVAADTRNSIRAVRSAVYVSDVDAKPQSLTFAIRVAQSPAALVPGIREALKTIDPSLEKLPIQTMRERITQSLALGFSAERALVSVFNVLGIVALLMVSVGLYGVTSYGVGRRTNEIGIRMALGAQRRDVVWLAQKDTVRIVMTGAIIGLLLSVPLMLLIRRGIFGLASSDPSAVLGVVALVLIISAIASYLPARRAAGVDPMRALRVE
jgi:predicted permease